MYEKLETFLAEENQVEEICVFPGSAMEPPEFELPESFLDAVTLADAKFQEMATLYHEIMDLPFADAFQGDEDRLVEFFAEYVEAHRKNPPKPREEARQDVTVRRDIKALKRCAGVYGDKATLGRVLAGLTGKARQLKGAEPAPVMEATA